MLYPLSPCETQPLIKMERITLDNIQQSGNVLPPGVIRCNETNPCTDFTFNNVNDKSIWTRLNFNYIVENVEGIVSNSSPIPAFTNLVADQEDRQVQAFVSKWFQSVEETVKGVRSDLQIAQRGFAAVYDFFNN